MNGVLRRTRESPPFQGIPALQEERIISVNRCRTPVLLASTSGQLTCDIEKFSTLHRRRCREPSLRSGGKCQDKKYGLANSPIPIQFCPGNQMFLFWSPQ